MKPQIKAFFDENTYTVSYVVSDPRTRKCAVIDPVLDFDAAAGRTGTTSAEGVVGYVHENRLDVAWILETHVHADHLSAAPYLKRMLGGQVAIGEHVTAVQAVFAELFNAGKDVATDGSQFDRLLGAGEAIPLGTLNVEVMHTPGHTPACVTYLIGDAAFVGDTLFMPDYGTARTDFPGGDAAILYRSIQKILALPPETRLFMCHDYKAPGRDRYAWETTVEAQRRSNVHVHEGITEQAFVAFREGRDLELDVPKLLLPSVQVNIQAGELPPPEDNGRRYLRIPIDAL